MGIPANTTPMICSLVIFCAACTGAAGAATAVIDSFHDVPFSLSHTGDSFIERSIVSPVVTNRIAEGVGTHEWAMESNAGSLRYSSHTPAGTANSKSFFRLLYTHESGAFSLLGNEAIRLNISQLTGQGLLTIVVGDAYPIDGVRVPITSSGAFDYPYSNLNDTSDLGNLDRLLISLNSDSMDFTITLDEVTLVPEPSGFALGAAGFLAFSLKRFRKSEL